MKHIFLIISKDIIRRNILDTAFWGTFLEKLPQEVSIVLIVDQASVESLRKTHESDRVRVEGYIKGEHVGFQKLLNFLIRTGINSHSTRTYRNRALRRGKSSYAGYAAKAILANTLGRYAWYKHVLRSLFTYTKAPKAVYTLYEKYTPIAVFAPSLIDSEFDAQFGRVAKQKKVRLLGMVRSWDNLNNHGVLSVVPDVWYFQNNFLREMAEEIQDIVLSKIEVRRVGLPHYDEYYDPTHIVIDRESFFNGLGLSPEKKLILLGGSDFYYSEDTLPKKLNDAVEKGHIQKEVQIVFRPHPARLFSLEAYQLEKLPHVILNDAFSGKEKFKDTDVFINLMYHADIIINIASTLSIDAAVFDTPAICINFDDVEKKLSYYESVHRLYDHFDHYERLVATGGVRTPDSLEQLIEDINAYLNNPQMDAEGRKKMIETFVEPFDGRASERLANAIVNDIRRIVHVQ